MGARKGVDNTGAEALEKAIFASSQGDCGRRFGRTLAAVIQALDNMEGEFDPTNAVSLVESVVQPRA